MYVEFWLVNGSGEKKCRIRRAPWGEGQSKQIKTKQKKMLPKSPRELEWGRVQWRPGNKTWTGLGFGDFSSLWTLRCWLTTSTTRINDTFDFLVSVTLANCLHLGTALFPFPTSREAPEKAWGGLQLIRQSPQDALTINKSYSLVCDRLSGKTSKKGLRALSMLYD